MESDPMNFDERNEMSRAKTKWFKDLNGERCFGIQEPDGARWISPFESNPQGCIIAQHNYDEKKVAYSGDHDRMMTWYGYECIQQMRKAAGTGELGWRGALRSLTPEQLINFTNIGYGVTNITGVRVLESTNVSSGYPVYTIIGCSQDGKIEPSSWDKEKEENNAKI
jgi:hypothetical protein